MIAAVCWVPKGVAKPQPEVVEPPSTQEIEELVRINAPSSPACSTDDDNDMLDNLEGDQDEKNQAIKKALAASRAVGANGHSGEARNANDIADELAELDMDNYEDEDEGIELFGNGGLGVSYYATNDMDPYLQKEESEDDEEIEDMTIKPSDLIILTARNEDGVSHLEMWVYEEETDEDSSNMYVHHDVMLAAFPLSLAWLDINLKGGERGNFVAVGTMRPEIEIWDLDLLDAVEPAVVLGGPLDPASEKNDKKSKKKKKKTKQEVQLKEGSHTDAVLGLAWNTEYRNVLASASADHSVKIWDVVAQKCEHTICCHSNKVQTVSWNPNEPTVLLSGSFDRTVTMLDMRAPTHKGIKWSVSADVESISWDPHATHSFVVSLEDGTVCCHDIRTVPSGGDGGKPLFTLHAHDKAVCSACYNTAVPNLLATVSMDKTVKLWDLTNSQPSCISSKNPKVGALFAAAFCKDHPSLLSMGGSKGKLEVLDIRKDTEVVRRFGKFLGYGSKRD